MSRIEITRCVFLNEISTLAQCGRTPSYLNCAMACRRPNYCEETHIITSAYIRTNDHWKQLMETSSNQHANCQFGLEDLKLTDSV